MRVFRHYDQLPDWTRGAVVALGNFDGVHRGHQAVIGRARAIAEDFGVPLGVLTFEPHPRTVFNPAADPFRLSSLRSKAHRLEAVGVDFMVAVHFDMDFSRLVAQDFVLQVLAEGLGVCHVVVGYDFVFGHKRGGDSYILGTMAVAEGFGLTVVEPVGPGGPAGSGGQGDGDTQVYSSTRIRDLLQAGDPRGAAELLGHWWEIEARVQPGDQRGRELGFPTLNLTLGDYLRPRYGVYAVRVCIDEAGTDWRDGVANLGIRPMFEKPEPLLEPYIFDFSGDLYGRNVRVALVDFLRDEANFASLDELVAAIEADCAKARAVLADPAYAFGLFGPVPGNGNVPADGT